MVEFHSIQVICAWFKRRLANWRRDSDHVVHPGANFKEVQISHRASSPNRKVYRQSAQDLHAPLTRWAGKLQVKGKFLTPGSEDLDSFPDLA